LKRAKQSEDGRPHVDIKPIQTQLKVTAKTARNYTKRPEVKAPPGVAVECGKSRLDRPRRASLPSAFITKTSS
jgi:hypothetical protein